MDTHINGNTRQTLDLISLDIVAVVGVVVSVAQIWLRVKPLCRLHTVWTGVYNMCDRYHHFNNKVGARALRFIRSFLLQFIFFLSFSAPPPYGVFLITLLLYNTMYPMYGYTVKLTHVRTHIYISQYFAALKLVFSQCNVFPPLNFGLHTWVWVFLNMCMWFYLFRHWCRLCDKNNEEKNRNFI